MCTQWRKISKLCATIPHICMKYTSCTKNMCWSFWSYSIRNLGVMKYSWKSETEEWIMPFAGWWRKVHNHADLCHSARACYYYHKCYFKWKDEKGNAWLWALRSSTGPLPVQSFTSKKWFWLLAEGLRVEERKKKKELVGISISLIPSTSNLQLHQPQKMPTNIPFKIEFHRFHDLSRKCMLQLNSSYCQGQLPTLMPKLEASCNNLNLFFLSYLQWWELFLSFFSVALLQIWKTLFSHHLKTRLIFYPVIPLIAFLWIISTFFTFSMECSAYNSWIPRSQKGVLLLPKEEGPRHASYRLHSCSYIPQCLCFFFQRIVESYAADEWLQP